MLGSVPPTFRKTWLFSFLCVHFLSYVISPVIFIAQPLQQSQHKCTTVNWNWVKKKRNILTHKNSARRGFSLLSLFKVHAAENPGLPQGLNSLFGLSVDRTGGWVARGMPYKQHACLRCLDANDRLRSKTWRVCETKGILLTVMLWGSSLLREGYVSSGPSLPWSDVCRSVMASSSLLSSISLQILIQKVQTSSPRGGRLIPQQRRKRGCPAEVSPCFSENWGRRGWRRGVRERK